MTRGAATAAGRTAGKPSTTGGPAAPPNRAHRRTLRPSGPAPRTPRRVSGPATGASTTAPRTAPAAKPRTAPAAKPRTAPNPRTAPAPRRAPSARRPPATPSLPLPRRGLAFIAALPDHRWLDRLVRGRAWIPVLGVLLVGIVAMQVEVLKLGASIGRSMNLATELQSRNQILRDNVARLSDDARIERLATDFGLVMPGPTEIRFVPGNGRGAVGKAIGGISAPDATSFISALAAQRVADAAIDPTVTPTTQALAAASAVAPTAGAATTTSTYSSTSTSSTAGTAATGAVGTAVGTTGVTDVTGATSVAPVTAPATSPAVATPVVPTGPAGTGTASSGSGTGGAGIVAAG